jgi:hypothetical protein
MNELTVFHIYDETNKKIYTKFIRLEDKMINLLDDKNGKYIYSYKYDINNNFNNTYAKDYEINSFFYLKKY